MIDYQKIEGIDYRLYPVAELEDILSEAGFTDVNGSHLPDFFASKQGKQTLKKTLLAVRITSAKSLSAQ